MAERDTQMPVYREREKEKQAIQDQVTNLVDSVSHYHLPQQ